MRAFFLPLLSDLHRERDESRCAYSAATLVWTMLLGFLLHLRTRNRMDARRMEGAYGANILALSGQRRAPGARARAACTGTAMLFLRALDPAAPALLQTLLLERLLRARTLRGGKLLGLTCIAVDATLRERKRGRGLSAKARKRMVLEAKIVTPWGWNLTVMSEPLEPWDDERQKQDCEQRAFERLAPRLKKAFPRLPVCILGDALYACRPIVETCRRMNWSYVLTCKAGRTPKTVEAVEKTLARAPRTHTGALPKGREGSVGWGRAEEIEYETGETALGNVVTVEETAPHAYKGAFVTDLAVGSAARAALLCDWGRRRWNIENGFHALKGRDGFGLEHCFCNDERAGENLHTLMTIAHTLWQLLHTGYLKRLERKHRHCTQICWAELLWEALRCENLSAEALEARVGARRMRFARE